MFSLFLVRSRIELKFTLKRPFKPLHQVSFEEPDPIQLRATPIWSTTILGIQTNPLMIFKSFSARGTQNACKLF